MLETYRQEDVQQILQLAIARQADAEELTRAQLLEIADEMGISTADLQIAEQAWLVRRGESKERQAFDLYRRSKFQRHLTKYLIVNAFLMMLAFITTGGLSWSLYIVLGWGLGLALNAWKTHQTEGEEYEEAFQNWCRRRRLKKTFNFWLDRWLKPV